MGPARVLWLLSADQDKRSSLRPKRLSGQRARIDKRQTTYDIRQIPLVNDGDVRKPTLLQQFSDRCWCEVVQMPWQLPHVPAFPEKP